METIVLFSLILLLPCLVMYFKRTRSETCGESLTWSLDDNGTLTISGMGVMPNYSDDFIPSTPWYSYRSSVKKVIIKDGVTSIGERTFSYCNYLTDIIVENGNVSYSAENGVLFNKDKTTLICYPEGKVGSGYIIPKSVTSIENGAFLNCDRLTAVTIPNRVTSIGNWAFAICRSLTTVTVPNSVTNIGEGAFANCHNLTAVTIGNGVISIGDNVFRFCRSLTTVTIPNSVTSIGEGAFARCINLTAIAIPNSVTSIGNGAFAECNDLTTVAIPNSVTSIGDWTFVECNNLAAVTIPNSVTSIGGGAFAGCISLTTITIPNSVTSIGKGAFVGCRRLIAITIPNSVTNIGSEAFSRCISLTAVTIGNSVTNIGKEAFLRCYSLTSVINLNPTPQDILGYYYASYMGLSLLNGEVFAGVDLSHATLYVPAESVEAYRAANVWKDFGTITPYPGVETCRRNYIDGTEDLL